MQDHYSDPADRERQEIYIAAEALLDERERNQQYIKRRDQENEEIALTVGKLRVELEAANKRIAELEAEPVSQAYNLAELIEGMEVSIDVSTCDADLGNRYFGTVTEALELDTAKNGYILLVQDAEPNFDVNGSSPVTPDGWVMVPKQVTPEISNAINVVGQRCTCGNCSQRLWDLLLDATQQGVNRG
ncbi:ead/Ea22-like family protein [Salmonella enterica subsp. enterica serovar Saintpaul]|nr:ead/Ea22-like family protein [Salmonella enterica subsp. enterica serovar Saintpaul]ECY3264107.1 ead/Ea22-like family protein [Salmonella enterica subsp. enterica serovar Saintpaul]